MDFKKLKNLGIQFIDRTWVRKIKWAYQRIRYGVCEEDVWSFDDHLCDIIIWGVKELAKKQTGCPGDVFDEDYFKKDKKNECWQWNTILEEIAQGFEAAKALQHILLLTKKNEDGSYSNEIDKVKQKQLSEKFDKGMDLFKKYFFSLWD